MCLGVEWFAASEERALDRKTNGVSIKEAENCLGNFDTTAYPVAEEMAGWIYRNWSLEKIAQLKPETMFKLMTYLIKKKNPQLKYLSEGDPKIIEDLFITIDN